MRYASKSKSDSKFMRVDTVAQKTVPMFGHFEKIDLP